MAGFSQEHLHQKFRAVFPQTASCVVIILIGPVWEHQSCQRICFDLGRFACSLTQVLKRILVSHTLAFRHYSFRIGVLRTGAIYSWSLSCLLFQGMWISWALCQRCTRSLPVWISSRTSQCPACRIASCRDKEDHLFVFVHLIESFCWLVSIWIYIMFYQVAYNLWLD